MDAKSKANFINSVVAGQKIPCPNCNALNDADSIYCFSCGTQITNLDSQKHSMEENVNVNTNEEQTDFHKNNSAPAFATVSNSKSEIKAENLESTHQFQRDVSTSAFRMAQPEPEEEVEEVSVFAEGLPDWDVVPPQVVVRRKSK